MSTQRHHMVSHTIRDPEVWLGVQDASDLLGVSPATLRRWSTAGKVRAFTTPGGHRRYAESTIRQLLGRATAANPSVAVLADSTERATWRLHEQLSPMCKRVGWVHRTSAEERQVLGLAGRSMVHGLLRYVSGRSDEECEAALRPAIEAAELHGRMAARHHGDLGETLETFHRVRGVIVDDLAERACVAGLDTPHATRLLARANDGIDRLILALVEAHAVAARRVER
jgi:Predicted site-specific integrase-resolvase